MNNLLFYILSSNIQRENLLFLFKDSITKECEENNIDSVLCMLRNKNIRMFYVDRWVNNYIIRFMNNDGAWSIGVGYKSYQTALNNVILLNKYI